MANIVFNYIGHVQILAQGVGGGRESQRGGEREREGGERERKRKKERQRHTERQTETDRQTDRQKVGEGEGDLPTPIHLESRGTQETSDLFIIRLSSAPLKTIIFFGQPGAQQTLTVFHYCQ